MIDDKSIKDGSSLVQIINSKKIGTSVKVTIWRNKASENLLTELTYKRKT